jgi:hypothetical protein
MDVSSTRYTRLEIVMPPLPRSHVWGSRTTKELALKSREKWPPGIQTCRAPASTLGMLYKRGAEC